MMYPLLITAAGILVCILVAYYGATSKAVRRASDIEPALKHQLLYSTIGATVVMMFVSLFALPA